MSAGATNGATTIPAAGSQPVQIAAPGNCTSIVIYSVANNDAVYLGGSSVTSSTGVPLAAQGYISFDLADKGEIYAAGTENNTLRWIAVGITP